MWATGGVARELQLGLTPTPPQSKEAKGKPWDLGASGHCGVAGDVGILSERQSSRSLSPEAVEALHVLDGASVWAESREGWAPTPSEEAEKYLGALTTLADVCASSAARDTIIIWEGSSKGSSQKEVHPRGTPVLRHLCRVLCCLCSVCLSENGIEYGGPTSPRGLGLPGASQSEEADVPSAEDWLSRGVTLLGALSGCGLAGVALRRVITTLYCITSCLCRSLVATPDAAALLQSAEGDHAFSFLAALSVAAAEAETRNMPSSAAAAPAATPGAGAAAAAEPPYSTIPSSSSSDSVLLLALLGAYEGLLALPGIASAARGGPLRGLHKAVQRGAARLLGKAASLRDSAVAVVAWLVYRRLSSSGGSSGSNDGSFSPTNVRHLLALLIASVRNHLRRPLEQRLCALCLREALKEPRMQQAVGSSTHDAALAFVAVCLQSLQTVVAAAAAAAQQKATSETSCDTVTPGQEGDGEKNSFSVREQLQCASPIAEMLALLCLFSPFVRASVAVRLDTLPPAQQASPDGAGFGSSNDGTPREQRNQHLQQQNQQRQPSQTSPGRGRSSAALSAVSLPSLFYIAANGDDLGCLYISAFLELCISCQDARGIGRYMSHQQREEVVASLAANAGLLLRGGENKSLGLRRATCLSLIAALWDGTEALGSIVETLCIHPLSVAGEEAAQQGDMGLLLRALHASLDLSACTKRHMPRSLRLLQRAAAALAAGPLSSPQTASEAEEALLVVYKCCALSIPVCWRALPPINCICSSDKNGAATGDGAAACGTSTHSDLWTAGSCPFMARLEGLSKFGCASEDRSWQLSGRPVAAALVEEARSRLVELKELRQTRAEAKNSAAQAAQRLAVTNEAHEVKIAALYYAPCSMEVNRIREAADRQERLHSAKEQRLTEEARKLRRELETEQQRGRELVAEFQRLLDAKEEAIATLQSNLGEGRTPHVPDISEISRDLQIQTAINVKQKEEISKQEAKLRSLLEKQQHTTNTLTALTEKHRQLQEEKNKLQINYEKVQDENEQQFRQLILVMKALAEQQAENGVLKEARMHAAANSEQQARQKLQQLEQQLQQMAREQESQARAASLRQVSLEEQLRAFQKENEALKARNRCCESTIEDLEKRLQTAVETAAGARAAAAAKSEMLNRMQQVQ
ncbi:hypothetical protein, conserved [Eimeria necatrix]|uniref:Uncharacterized protein n=1 Tax=Eimeria necatrix TaxID=51315 RepID=U6MSN6_9EIME|nr:hypothetical protein, conserved [Eimeria necatrix]CDJ64670.1 hypothetical protein, conserved [Eimeria necatrix]